MYESSDISKYIRKTYGGGRPLVHWLGPINLILSNFAVLVRLISGTFARKSNSPEKPFELFGAERHPGTRLVKELLCVHEIEYLWRPGGGAETNTPFLVDPNCDVSVSGSYAIRQYVKKAYSI